MPGTLVYLSMSVFAHMSSFPLSFCNIASTLLLSCCNSSLSKQHRQQPHLSCCLLQPLLVFAEEFKRRYDEEHAKEPAEGHGRHEPSQHANEYGPNEQDASAPCAQTDGWPRSPSGSHETDGGYEMSHHFWLVYECQICGLILHQLESMRRV